MMPERIIHDQVELTARYASRQRGIGEGGTKQRSDARFRHQPEHSVWSQRELGHARDVKRRLIAQYRSPKCGGFGLISHIQDEMRGPGHVRPALERSRQLST